MSLNEINNTNSTSLLLADIKQLIAEARQRTAASFNSEITLMYWHIGERINREFLDNQRAEYGKQIVVTLSRQLQIEFGSKGFDAKSIRRMMQFARVFPDLKIVAPLSRQLSWSHFIEIIVINDSLQREFYMTMAATEKWSIRTLRAQIDGMLYERMTISGKADELIKQELTELRENNQLTPDLVFKTPYFLEFTGLKGFYSEKSLEDSLIVCLEQFIMELGAGFTFVERQKRMVIDGEDFYLDLLFYHRKLRRLIAVELKLGRFKAQYKGQMELYLRWLGKNEAEQGEQTPLGLILCTEGSREQIELLQLDNAGIKVANYLTELPPKELLQAQLKKTLAEEKARNENKDILKGDAAEA